MSLEGAAIAAARLVLRELDRLAAARVDAGYLMIVAAPGGHRHRREKCGDCTRCARSKALASVIVRKRW